MIFIECFKKQEFDPLRGQQIVIFLDAAEQLCTI